MFDTKIVLIGLKYHTALETSLDHMFYTGLGCMHARGELMPFFNEHKLNKDWLSDVYSWNDGVHDSEKPSEDG